MIKKLLLGLVLLISLVSSYSYTNISTCQTINSSFSWYDSEREIRLNDSLVSNGTTTCLSLNINNIILNCQSNSIDGNGSTSIGIGNFFDRINNITVKNCTVIDGNQINIFSNNTKLINSTLYDTNIYSEGTNLTLENNYLENTRATLYVDFPIINNTDFINTSRILIGSDLTRPKHIFTNSNIVFNSNGFDIDNTENAVYGNINISGTCSSTNTFGNVINSHFSNINVLGDNCNFIFSSFDYSRITNMSINNVDAGAQDGILQFISSEHVTLDTIEILNSHADYGINIALGNPYNYSLNNIHIENFEGVGILLGGSNSLGNTLSNSVLRNISYLSLLLNNNNLIYNNTFYDENPIQIGSSTGNQFNLSSIGNFYTNVSSNPLCFEPGQCDYFPQEIVIPSIPQPSQSLFPSQGFISTLISFSILFLFFL